MTLSRHDRVRMAAVASFVVFAAIMLFIVRPWLHDGHGLKATYRGADGRVELERTERAIDGDRGRWPVALRGKTVTWEGTIVFPRARYYLALEAQPMPRIFLDGKPVQAAVFPYGKNRPTNRPTLIETAGPHSLKVEYAVGAVAQPRIRLMWLAPGRRGLPEYVPPSALFPDAPDKVDISAARSDFRPTGWVVLALILGFIAVLVVWSGPGLRRWLRATRDDPAALRAVLIGLGVCAFAAVFRYIDLNGAGATWDEDVHRSAGLDYVVNLVNLDFRESSWRWIPEHPTVTMLFYGVGAVFEDGYTIERALAVMAGVGTVALVMLIARRLFDNTTAVIAGLLYAVIPPVIALHKNVSHEAVVGFTFTAALYAYLCALDRPTTRGWISAGVLCGLAVASRVTSGLLVPLTAILFGLHYARTPRPERPRPWKPLALVWAVAFATFVLVWPYMWTGMFTKIGHMFSFHGAVGTDEYYFGHFIKQPPWHYLFVYFAITIPVGLLAAVAIGLGRSGLEVYRTRISARDIDVAVWFLIAFAVALGPAIKDGPRYMFPGFGAAAILAARACTLVPRRARIPLGALLAVYVSLSALRVHPYYLDYYSELVGGAGEVQRKRSFETAWWGEGLQAATDYVDRVAPAGATIWLHAEPKHVMSWRDDLVRADRPGADYVIQNDRVPARPVLQQNYDIVFESKAGDAVMSRVWKKRVK